MKTASVLGAALALLAAPALAQYGGERRTRVGLSAATPAGPGLITAMVGHMALPMAPITAAMARRPIPGADRSTMATPAITAARVSSWRARIIRGGSIGRTRGSIGVGSERCSAARPKARRSTPRRAFTSASAAPSMP